MSELILRKCFISETL